MRHRGAHAALAFHTGSEFKTLVTSFIHRTMTRMFKSAICLCVLAMFAISAGAKPSQGHTVDRSKKRPEVPRDLDLTADAPASPSTNKPAASTTATKNKAASPATTPAPKPVAVAPPTPGFIVPAEEWIALDRWARQNQLGGLTNQSTPGSPTFALRTPTGEFVVRTSSALALWNGLELRLGFEPRLIGEEPFLHRLDLEKNLVPLLVNVPSPTSGPRLVVLDPGHGGADSGTCSAQGDLEKEYTLDWGLRLEALLESAGWTVVLTRTNDAQVSLTERVAIADRHKADLFLSLHFNATTQPYHAGIETYCVTPMGMPSNVTRGYEDNPALVFPNNLFDAQNVQLAMNMHRSILASTGGRDRGIRRARFLTVLRGQSRPAVLLEGGYLSNPDEARLITSAAYRQKLAEAVAKALQCQ